MFSKIVIRRKTSPQDSFSLDILRTLRYLIDAHPSALLYLDNKKRTPLHAAFDMPSNFDGKLPHLGIVQALLTPPGNSAAKLKVCCFAFMCLCSTSWSYLFNCNDLILP